MKKSTKGYIIAGIIVLAGMGFIMGILIYNNELPSKLGGVSLEEKEPVSPYINDDNNANSNSDNNINDDNNIDGNDDNIFNDNYSPTNKCELKVGKILIANDNLFIPISKESYDEMCAYLSEGNSEAFSMMALEGTLYSTKIGERYVISDIGVTVIKLKNLATGQSIFANREILDGFFKNE